MRHGRTTIATLIALVGCNDGAEDTTGDLSFEPVLAPGQGELPPAPCAAFPPTSSFVERHQGELRVDGNRFGTLGGNIYFLQQLFAYAEGGDKVSDARGVEALDAAVCMNLRVVRTVGFNDRDEASSIRSAPGVYREQGLRGLDRAVSEARKRGIRLVIPLVNNWADYGGLPQYAAWTGRPVQARDDFFGDEAMMQMWRDYASLLAQRVNVYTGVAYKDEPTIMAWEIGNELRCRSCRGSNRYVETITALARHLKAVAPRQLIADGGEGFDDNPAMYAGLSNPYPVRGDEGASYSRLLAVGELDMVSYHLYPGPTEGYGLDAGQDAKIWITAHETLARQAGKVGYLGEFGFIPSGSQDADASRAATFHHWLRQLFEQRQGHLGMFWQLSATGRLAQEDDGHSVVYGRHQLTSVALARWARRVWVSP